MTRLVSSKAESSFIAIGALATVETARAWVPVGPSNVILVATMITVNLSATTISYHAL